MSDRLALANAIEDAGIERAKAAAIASVISDMVHGAVATKADLQASEATLRSEVQSGFARQDAAFARQDVAIERLRSSRREMESRITLRLGGIVAAGVAIIVVLQHLWR
jgi:hypothetical protein